ncbi:MAG: hypothetical protein VX035_05625, partial [Planctomycetota bacterium]|nr:hypothetical protein [Planctomycetota bacterium]
GRSKSHAEYRQTEKTSRESRVQLVVKSGNPVRPTSQRGIPAVTVNPNGDRMGRKKSQLENDSEAGERSKKGS